MCQSTDILNLGFDVEMCVIVTRMDACVGAAATSDGDRLTQFEAQALLHRFLHAFGVWLDLITMVATTIVGHIDEISRHLS